MKQRKVKILVVDDDEKIRRTVSAILREQEYEVAEATDGTEALEMVRANGHSLVLLDYQLPDYDGLQVLAELRSSHPELPVVMMSGYGTISLAVEATKLGAYDFLEKPLSAERLLVTVGNVLEKYRLRLEVAELRRETLARYEMVGNSAPMQRVYEMIDRAAPTRASVLILGESGVGKELVARAIHRKSLAWDGPFVRLNCAAIPENLIESELFGHEKGAFTGAAAQKPGKVELADNGTLFLDEVGDMNFGAQAKLLRFLQDGEYERVGGTGTLKAKVRVIAATNKDLAREIEEKRFREDLLYRLNVITLNVPPLRERAEDIPLLAEHFLRQFCDEQGVSGKEFAEDALKLLAAQPWKGNVRELANVVQRCVVLLPGSELTARDIEPLLAGLAAEPCTSAGPQCLKLARDEFERQHILRVLDECEGNVSEAARVLDINRTGLYKAMERLGIQTD